MLLDDKKPINQNREKKIYQFELFTATTANIDKNYKYKRILYKFRTGLGFNHKIQRNEEK